MCDACHYSDKDIDNSDRPLASYAVFNCFLNAQKYVIPLLHLTMLMVVIITETHAN